MPKKIEIVAEVLCITKKSFYLIANGNGGWVPRNMVDHSPDPNTEEKITFEIPKSLAEEKGFI